MTLPPSGPRPVDPRTLQAPGDPAPTVDAAVAELDGLGDRPLTEHVAVFERIHAALGDALAAGEAAGRT